MRFTLKNPCSLQYIDYQNVKKTEFLGCQSQEYVGIIIVRFVFGAAMVLLPFLCRGLEISTI